jgi:hypothetical protein
MGRSLTFIAATLLLAAASSSADAQAPPETGKKDAAGAQTTSPQSPPADAGKAKMEPEKGQRRAQKAKPRRHARAGSRPRRAARHRGWRRVWVYQAHDRHGHRDYRLVWRKFGGYFARPYDCSCWRRSRAGYL